MTYLPQIFIEEIVKTTGIFLTWFNISNLVEYGINLVSGQNYVPKKISACLFVWMSDIYLKGPVTLTKLTIPLTFSDHTSIIFSVYFFNT